MASRIYIYNKMPKISSESRKRIIMYVFITSPDALSKTNTGGVVVDWGALDDVTLNEVKNMIDNNMYRKQ
jgi:hypothetical protein